MSSSEGITALGKAWCLVEASQFACSGKVFSLSERTPEGARHWNTVQNWGRDVPSVLLKEDSLVRIPRRNGVVENLPSYGEEHARNEGRRADIVNVEREKVVLKIKDGPDAGSLLAVEIMAFPRDHGRLCYRGCALTGHICPRQGFSCDSCSLLAPRGSPMLCCREHDYDLCMFCAGFHTDVNNVRVIPGPTHPNSTDTKSHPIKAGYATRSGGGYNVVWEAEGDKQSSEQARGAPYQDLIPVYDADVFLMGRDKLLDTNRTGYTPGEDTLQMLHLSERYALSANGRAISAVKDNQTMLLSKHIFSTTEATPVLHICVKKITGRISIGIVLDPVKDVESPVGMVERSVSLSSTVDGAQVINSGSEATPLLQALKSGDIVSVRIAFGAEDRGELVYFVNGEQVPGNFNFAGSFRYAVSLGSVDSAIEITNGAKLQNRSIEMVDRTRVLDGKFHFMDVTNHATFSSDGSSVEATGAKQVTVVTREVFGVGSPKLCSFVVTKLSLPISFGMTGFFVDSMEDDIMLGSTLLEGTVGFQCREDGCWFARDGERKHSRREALAEGDVVSIGLSPTGQLSFFVNDDCAPHTVSLRGQWRMAATISSGTALKIVDPHPGAVTQQSVGQGSAADPLAGLVSILGEAFASALQSGSANDTRRASGSSEDSSSSSSSSSSLPTVPSETAKVVRQLIAERSVPFAEPFEFIDILTDVDVESGDTVCRLTSNGLSTVITKQIAPREMTVFCTFRVKSCHLPMAFGITGETPCTGLSGYLLGEKGFADSVGLVFTPKGAHLSKGGKRIELSKKGNKVTVLKSGDTVSVGWTENGALLFLLNEELLSDDLRWKGGARFAVSMAKEGCEVAIVPKSLELLRAICGIVKTQLGIPDLRTQIESANETYDSAEGFSFIDILTFVSINSTKKTAEATSTHPCTVLTSQGVNAGRAVSCTFKIETLNFPIAFGVTKSYPEGVGSSMIGQAEFKGTMGLVCTDDGCYLAKDGKMEKLDGIPAVREGDTITVHLTALRDVAYEVGRKRIPARVKLTGGFRMAISFREVGTKVVILPETDTADGLLEWGDLTAIKKLSDGARSASYTAKLFGTQGVVVKVLRGNRDPTTLHREAKILQDLRHPNVICFHGCVRTPQGAFSAITERYANGNLAQYISQNVLSPKAKMRLIRTFSNGMAFFSRRYVHGGIKPSNVLVTASGDGVVGELGLSRANVFDDPAGALYHAPEVLEGGACTVASDVYSTGMLLRFVTVGNDDIEILFDLAASPSPATAKQAQALPMTACSDAQRTLIRACLDTPKKRPLFKNLVLLLKDIEKAVQG